MTPKIVQIVGACRVNQGDRLMVHAIQQRLGHRYFLPLPVVLNTPAARFWGPKNMALMLLQAVFRSLQYLRHGRPRILLDCSGYQYGDPWAEMGKVLSLRLLAYQAFRARGGRIILLPQSLGPFRKRTMASVAAGVFQLADRVFARDEISRRHAIDVGCPAGRIDVKPDYSNAVEPILPPRPERWTDRVALVPSLRMLDKTPEPVASRYLEALRRCAQYVRSRGLEPFILVHDLEDRDLARRLRASIPGTLRMVVPAAREAKGIIASCRALVASRYHALVGALSQGVPAVGTGWTHKYRVLFRDYAHEDGLVERIETGNELVEALSRLCTDPERGRIVEALRAGAERQSVRTNAMFESLEALLAGEAPPG
jgi:colanic acid/amylovoran biosynthesis protein